MHVDLSQEQIPETKTTQVVGALIGKQFHSSGIRYLIIIQGKRDMYKILNERGSREGT